MILPSSSSSSKSPAKSGTRTKTPTRRSQVAEVLAGLLILVTPVRAATTAMNNVAEAESEGRKLVQQLLEQRPTENLTNTGVLKIHDAKSGRRQTSVEFQIAVTPTNVLAIYIAKDSRAGPSSQTLTITHGGTTPNGYILKTGSGEPGRW